VFPLKGILVILSLLFFTPYFFYIPKSALAGIIISAVIFMVEVRVVKPMWRSKKADLIPGLSAFVACLVLPLELGILVGIGLNILFILYHASRPKIHMERVIVSAGNIFLRLSFNFFL
jgi:solute carrier family 26 (sodium-independent sulfate anion transporter), member 11